MLLTVFRGHSSFWGLGITASRWLSFRVVDSLSWPLTVFQSFLFNCYFWLQTLLTASRWQSPKVFCLFPYNTNKITGSLAVFQMSFTVTEVDFQFIPATQSSAVFQGRYLSLQISFVFPYGRSRVQFSMKFQIQ